MCGLSYAHSPLVQSSARPRKRAYTCVCAAAADVHTNMCLDRSASPRCYRTKRKDASTSIHACRPDLVREPCTCVYACMITCTRARTRALPFPISWKKVHILSLRRTQLPVWSRRFSSRLLRSPLIVIDSRARSQSLDDSEVLDMF